MYQPDLTRLKKCMNRAMNGEELTIAFLGGSITQGSLASSEENTYAYRVFAWWEKTFPKAGFHYVNGGIGGTSSHYGAARAVTDVLMYQPDFVVVDFSVNDAVDGEGTAFFQETYEGVLRRILGWPSAPAALLLNNVYYDTGLNAQGCHNAVGEWYGVPWVSIKDTVYRRMKAGEYTREELTPDGLHPNDKGHALVAAEITDFLERVKERMTGTESGGKGQPDILTESGRVTLPEPMTANAYEDAKRLTIREISPALLGFRADVREKQGHLDHFKNGWIGKKPGDAIRFEVEASCIAVQYRKTINRPAVRAELTLDGDREHTRTLDGNFEEDWGDCLFLEPVLHHGAWGKHTVEITIPATESEQHTEFYLMALIIA